MNRNQWISMVVAVVLISVSQGRAQDSADDRIQRLEQQLQSLTQSVQQRDARIQQLEERISSPETAERRREANQELLEEMMRDVEAREAAAGAGGGLQVGESNVRLTDLSAIINLAAGTSNHNDGVIDQLQLGAHDPKRNGFTFQQLELSIAGAVDPYFTAETYVVITEGGIELEEAFATTSSLPAGLEFEAGFFLTEFGRVNPAHPHSWDWIDQPIINSRLLGPDGLRAPGVRLGWLTPLPWFSEFHVGMQHASGETQASFRGEGLGHAHGEEGGAEEAFEEGIGGFAIIEDQEVESMRDFIYLTRWVNGFDLSEDVSTQIGLSSLFGPNHSGPDGETWIYGADFVVKWQPGGQGQFVTWQTEVMQREFMGDDYFNEVDPLDPNDDINIAARRIYDWGVSTQVLYGFMKGWSTGIRYEFASGRGDTLEEGAREERSHDPFRADRHRISPLVMWRPSEFSRVRVQYNYDQSDHLDAEAHSVWIGLEFLIGAHPAHRY